MLIVSLCTYKVYIRDNMSVYIDLVYQNVNHTGKI